MDSNDNERRQSLLADSKFEEYQNKPETAIPENTVKLARHVGSFTFGKIASPVAGGVILFTIFLAVMSILSATLVEKGPITGCYLATTNVLDKTHPVATEDCIRCNSGSSSIEQRTTSVNLIVGGCLITVVVVVAMIGARTLSAVGVYMMSVDVYLRNTWQTSGAIVCSVVLGLLVWFSATKQDAGVHVVKHLTSCPGDPNDYWAVSDIEYNYSLLQKVTAIIVFTFSFAIVLQFLFENITSDSYGVNINDALQYDIHLKWMLDYGTLIEHLHNHMMKTTTNTRGEKIPNPDFKPLYYKYWWDSVKLLVWALIYNTKMLKYDVLPIVVKEIEESEGYSPIVFKRTANEKFHQFATWLYSTSFFIWIFGDVESDIRSTIDRMVRLKEDPHRRDPHVPPRGTKAWHRRFQSHMTELGLNAIVPDDNENDPVSTSHSYHSSYQSQSRQEQP